MKNRLIHYYLLWLLIIPVQIAASSSNLPRFASLKFKEVNIRVGPGTNYPIAWTFFSKHEPIEIIEEFAQWRKIRDIKNEQGWAHVSTLSSARYIIIDKLPKNAAAVFLYRSSNVKSPIVAKVFTEVKCQLKKIKSDWCQVKCNEVQGWIESQYAWGLHDHEL